MSNKDKPANPWNKNKAPQPSKKQQKQNAGVNLKGSSPTISETKFKQAHAKNQEAVKKYAKDYESSSEEEEIQDSNNYIANIVQNYTKTGGTTNLLGRTQKILEESFTSGASTCLICIRKVKRTDEVWTCTHCYEYFHLICIQRWSKDTITQQKQSQEGQIVVGVPKRVFWSCPKCRFELHPEEIPSKYLCFCGKLQNPPFQPYLVPHSCGQVCQKNLQPLCGHKCTLLCHPGPCPPCPVTVSVTCFCGRQSPRGQKCNNRGWSCGEPCARTLSCDKHKCAEPCHEGSCNACPKKSIQWCMCGSKQKLRDCAEPIWQCDKVCNKPLDCGNHRCDEVCHAGVCDTCALSKERTCPCGKRSFQLPCTEETPTCLSTCDKPLDCEHSCSKKCHKDECGECLLMVEKVCRCGQHSKEMICSKPFFCMSKCKLMKDCNKHQCKQKCCDGNCPPCEKICGNSLSCGQHKCTSVCHTGPCFPCNKTEIVACVCGDTKITVSCGRKRRTKPPKCTKPCPIKPDCHHEQREKHRSHYGDCPPCRQTCNKTLAYCEHLCPAPCHSAVLVRIEPPKAATILEQLPVRFERQEFPCPSCIVPMPVTCLGGHETAKWPCFQAKPTSCQRPCGRLLTCENHICELPCHFVKNSLDDKAERNCEICESSCDKPRPEGCKHDCPKPCHPGLCPPCTQLQRIKCHCGLTQKFVKCHEWLNSNQQEEVQSCGDQCPKNYDCGHRCKANCHSGPCPNSELCNRKVKISCKCKRLKKQFSCNLVRENNAKVECDEVCLQIIAELEKKKLEELEEQRRKEEEKNRLEVLQLQRDGKKKSKKRRQFDDDEDEDFFTKLLNLLSNPFVVFGFLFVVVLLTIYFVI